METKTLHDPGMPMLECINREHVLEGVRLLVDHMNKHSMSTAEAGLMIVDIYLSVMGAIEPEARWDARTRIISMLMRASVLQDRDFDIHPTPESTQ